MPENWCQAGMMRNCAMLLGKSLAPDLQLRSDSVPASAPGCKGNRTGASPIPRTQPTIYLSVRMRAHIQLSPVSSNQDVSFVFSPIIRPGFELAAPATHSARQAVRHQFTPPFLLITGSLPAKYIAAKGLAPHLSSAAVCRNPWLAGTMETLVSYSGASGPLQKC
jgi:hypothetical protein